jgi:hypothetical protein
MRTESASLLRELKELTGAAEWLLRFLLYFSHVGVQRAERLMRTDEESSVLEFTRKLRAIDIGGEWRTVRAEYLQTLERIEDEASFALAALRQAMALDIHLASTPRAAETTSLLRDGRTYRLVQQNNFIGTAGEPTTGATRQGGEYRTYIQKFMLFEEHEQHGLRRRRFDDWAASQLETGLRSDRAFTGVLIDALHNVALAYPSLEDQIDVWQAVYALIRSYGATCVSTFTAFDLARSDHLWDDMLTPSTSSQMLAQILAARADASVFFQASDEPGDALVTMPVSGEYGLPSSAALIWRRRERRFVSQVTRPSSTRSSDGDVNRLDRQR